MADVTEAEVTIAEAGFVERFPELHHYTTAAGLKGIFTSNTVWATHYADLNDSQEIIHFKSALRTELTECFTDMLRRKRRESLKVDRAINATGGLTASATGIATDLTESFYRSAFEGAGQTPPSRTAGAAYIASFCTHSNEPYQRENGLLSQWRGYAVGGGYCLVFDSPKLVQLLLEEWEARPYSYLNINPVHYAMPGVTARSLFPQFFERAEAFIEAALEGQRGDEALADAALQIYRGATLFKHQAFFEEREVRISAIPVTPRFRDAILEAQPDAPDRPLKQVQSIERAGSARRYIELFREVSTPLPVKRVIVGPSSDQVQRAETARAICGTNVEVVLSDTPFIG
jgi:hypothetical protein